jgi:hypothetical protein
MACGGSLTRCSQAQCVRNLAKALLRNRCIRHACCTARGLWCPCQRARRAQVRTVRHRAVCHAEYHTFSDFGWHSWINTENVIDALTYANQACSPCMRTPDRLCRAHLTWPVRAAM